MKKYWNLLLCSLLLVFTVGCSGNSDGDEPEGETGELLLTSSAAYIENNGTDQAVFTVMKGKKNVTAEAKIYQKKGGSYDILPSTSFSSKTQGEYSFFAINYLSFLQYSLNNFIVHGKVIFLYNNRRAPA